MNESKHRIDDGAITLGAYHRSWRAIACEHAAGRRYAGAAHHPPRALRDPTRVRCPVQPHGTRLRTASSLRASLREHPAGATLCDIWVYWRRWCQKQVEELSGDGRHAGYENVRVGRTGMADQEYLAVLKQDVSTWNSWRAAHLDVATPNLSEADLRGATLQKVNLRGATLAGADLRVAILRGADLNRADLQGADLQCAWLSNAFLQGADLHGADLRGTWLSGAKLTGGGLPAARLTGTTYNTRTCWPADFTPPTDAVASDLHPPTE